MAKTPYLTRECAEGYVYAGDGNKNPRRDCPYLFSSNAWLAWMAGVQVGGMSAPTFCRMARGYSVRILTSGGNIVIVTASSEGLETFTVDRQ